VRSPSVPTPPTIHDPVAVADVNGDGHANLVTITTFGSAYVYPGQRNGTFSAGVASFAGTFDSAYRDGVGHWVIGAADVTGDGRADLVTAHSNGRAYVFPGWANLQFGSAVDSFRGTLDLGLTDGAGHQPVGVADVDGNGLADLVTLAAGTVYVYEGTRRGAFGAAQESFAGTMASSQFGDDGHEIVGVYDVTGDGRADLITVHSNQTAYVYPGRPTRRFAAPAANFAGTLDSSRADGSGLELVGEGPYPRRRTCAVTGCRAR